METKLKSALGIGDRLLSRAACLGAVILICSSASAQNLFVSGFGCGGGEIPNNLPVCGKVVEFTWDGRQIVFASLFNFAGDLAFDSIGNLFVVDCVPCWTRYPGHVIYKITSNGVRTIFASGLSSPLSLAADKEGNLFVADYDSGVIYKYMPDRSRVNFASGLYHPVGLAFNSLGDLFVADNNSGSIYQGSIYQYKPDGKRATFVALDPSDRPEDLAFDSMGHLFMADFGGNIYRYDLHGIRATFGSVPNSAQSVACDSVGNLFVLDIGDVNGDSDTIYKFTPQGARSEFVSGQDLGETFSHIAFQPGNSGLTLLPRARPIPHPRPTPR